MYFYLEKEKPTLGITYSYLWGEVHVYILWNEKCTLKIFFYCVKEGTLACGEKGTFAFVLFWYCTSVSVNAYQSIKDAGSPFLCFRFQQIRSRDEAK